MKKIYLLVMTIIVMICFSGTVSGANYDQVFPSEKLRHGSEYKFYDMLNAGSWTTEVYEVVTTFTEHGNYNEAADPEFAFTQEILNDNLSVSPNNSTKMVEADRWYKIERRPAVRATDNITIVYNAEVIEQTNPEAGDDGWGDRRWHSEYQPYEITACGDGVVDRYYDKFTKTNVYETCDPADSSKAGWGTGGCSDTCEPLVDTTPVCQNITASVTSGEAPQISNVSCTAKNVDEIIIDCGNGDTTLYAGNPGGEKTVSGVCNYSTGGSYTAVCKIKKGGQELVVGGSCQKPINLSNPIPSIDIIKTDANGADEDTIIGTNDSQTVKRGNEAIFRITVTNNGAEPLTSVIVTDPNAPSCNKDFGTLILQPGESAPGYDCTKANTQATYINTASVSGVGTVSRTGVDASDPTTVNMVEASCTSLSATPNSGTATFQSTLSCDGLYVDSYNIVITKNGTQVASIGAKNGTYNFTEEGNYMASCYIDGKTTTQQACIKPITVDPTPVPRITVDKRDANPVDRDGVTGTNDSQTIYRNGEAIFKIRVTNTGNERLKNIKLSDTISPTCAGNVSLPNTRPNSFNDFKTGGVGNKSDMYLEKDEWFEYTCTHSGESTRYDNIVEVTANGENTDILVDAENSTAVEMVDPVCNNLSIDNTTGFPGLVSNLNCSGTNVDSYKIVIKNSSGNVVSTMNSNVGQYTFANAGTYTASCYVNDRKTTETACDGSANTITVNQIPVPSIEIVKTDANDNEILEGSETKGDDTQRILKGTASKFSITVTNNGDEALEDVQIRDPLAPACDKDYASLAVDESKTYECEKTNIQAGYTNVANVTGVGVTSGQNATDTDPTTITVVEPSCTGITASPSTGSSAFDTTITCAGNYATSYEIKIRDASGAVVKTITSNTGTYNVSTVGNYTATCYVNGLDSTVPACETPIVLQETPVPKITVDKRDANSEDRDGVTGTNDSQKIYQGNNSVFKIRVRNSGTETLDTIILEDEMTQACAGPVTLPSTYPSSFSNFKMGGSAAGIDNTNATLEPNEWFEYTCQKTNVVDGFTNSVTAKGTGVISGTNVEDDDTTEVVVVNPVCTGMSVDKVMGEPTFTSNFECSGTDTDSYKIVITDSSDGSIVEQIASQSGSYDFSEDGTYTVSCYVNDQTTTAGSCQKDVVVGAIGGNPSITINKIDANFEADYDEVTGNDTQTVRDGETAFFKIVVTNNGTEDLKNIVLTDPNAAACAGEVTLPNTYPAGFKNFSISGQGDHSNDILEPGEVFEYTCKELNTTSNYNNRATVKAESVSDDTEVESTDITEVLIGHYDLSLQKTVDEGPYYSGGFVTFRIEVFNDGTLPSGEIQVTDYIPEELPLMNFGEWDEVGNKAIRRIGNIPAGQSEMLEISFWIPEDITGNITNWAEISVDDGKDCDSNPDSNIENDDYSRDYDENNTVPGGCNQDDGDEDDHDPATITVEEAQPSVLVEKYSNQGSSDQDGNVDTNPEDDSQTINSGETPEFNIVVTNNGTEPLTNIEVTDTLVANCNKDFGDLVLDPGESTDPYSCTAQVADAGYTNVAVVTAEGIDSEDTVGDEDDSHVVIAEDPEPAIMVEKFSNQGETDQDDNKDTDENDDSQLIDAGDTAKFTIRVTNTGNEELVNVVVTDFAAGNLEVDCGMTYDSLAIEEVKEYDCELSNTTVGYTNVASAAAQGKGSGIGVNDTDPTEVVLAYNPMPEVMIEKFSNQGEDDQDTDKSMEPTDDSQTINLGETAKFTIRVTNTGNEDLKNVVVTDIADGREYSACNRTIASLPVGGAPVEYICTIPNTTKAYTNEVSVDAKGKDSNVEVSDDDDSQVEIPGDPYACQNLNVMTSPVGTESTFSCNGSAGMTGYEIKITQSGSVIHTIGAASGGYTFTNEGLYSAVCYVGGETTQPNQACSDDIYISEPAIGPKIKIEKYSNNLDNSVDVDGNIVDSNSNDSQLLSSGTTAKFTIRVTNIGSEVLKDIEIIDTISGASYSSCNKSYATLAVGGVETYECEKSNATAYYINKVDVTATGQTSNTEVSDSDETQVDVFVPEVDEPSIAVEKYSNQGTTDRDGNQDKDEADDSQTIQSGETAKFNIVVKNNGNVAVTNINVTDVIEATCDKDFRTLVLLPGQQTSVISCTKENATDDYINTAVATANPVGSTDDLTDEDGTAVKIFNSSNNPSIEVVKYSNQGSADSDGNQAKNIGDDNQKIPSTTTPKFNIKVTNNGNVDLTNIVVSDPLAPNCNKDFGSEVLEPGASFDVYECEGAATSSAYTNTANVTSELTNGSTGPIDSDTSTVQVEGANPGNPGGGSGGGSSFRCTELEIYEVTDDGTDVTSSVLDDGDIVYATYGTGALEVKVRCTGNKENSARIDCGNEGELILESNGKSSDHTGTCVYSEADKGEKREIKCHVSRAQNGGDLYKTTYGGAITGGYTSRFACSKTVELGGSIPVAKCGNKIVETGEQCEDRGEGKCYPEDSVDDEGNLNECTLIPDAELNCSNSVQYQLDNPEVCKPELNCGNDDYYEANKNICETVTYPGEGELQFGFGGTALIGHGGDAFKGRNVFVRNLGNEPITLDKELCIYNKDHQDPVTFADNSIFTNKLDYTCISGSNIGTIYPVADPYDVDNLSDPQVKKFDIQALGKFIGDISTIPAGEAYYNNELALTANGFGAAYFAESVHVVLSKPAPISRGGGINYMDDSSNIASIEKLVELINQLADDHGTGVRAQDGQTNYVGTVLGDTANLSNIDNVTGDNQTSAQLEGQEFGTGTLNITGTIGSDGNSISYGHFGKYNGRTDVMYIKDKNFTINAGNVVEFKEDTTYIIEKGHLTIATDIKDIDNIGFIVAGGNITIKDVVTEIEGTFHSIGGEILPEDESTPNSTNRLTVKGILSGNDSKLIQNRTYMKLTNAGVIETGLEYVRSDSDFNRPAPLVSTFVNNFIEANKVAQ